MKNTLKIIIPIAATFILVVSIYFGWQYLSNPVAPTGANDSVTNGGGEEARASIIQKLNDDAISDFWINKKTNETNYVSSDGRILKLVNNQPSQILSEQKISNINYARPSFDGTMALIAFGPSQSLSFSIFDTSKKSFQSLPQGATAASWDPQSNDRIAYLRNNGTSGFLSILEVKTGKSSDIIKITQKDSQLSWPFPDTIYLNERPSNTYAGSIWSLNIKTKILKAISKEEKGASIQWLPSQKIGLKSLNGKLSLVGLDGKNLDTIGLFTLSDKCLLEKLMLYCGAPISQSSRSFSVDAQLKNPTSKEGIYLVPIGSIGKGKELLASGWFHNNELETPINVGRIEKQGNNLIILNQLDHKLYSLSL